MNNILYEALIKRISYAIQKSINEMARLSVQRTIDKKLWLSVASTCSRNKSTEAENIRPVGSDKENLLNRYVAALIIMRKSCPKTEDDIDTLKTFKLVGKRYLQLGGTLEEIQSLYNKNTGKGEITSTNNAKKPVQKKEEYTDNNVSNEPVQKDTYGGMGLFDDDDIFGDDTDDINSELTQNIVGLDIDADLTTVLIQQLGNKPRGWKFYKHTNDEYEKYMTADVCPFYEWRLKKYVRDVISVIKLKNWACYNVVAPTDWKISSFKIENTTEDAVYEQFKRYFDFVNNKKEPDKQLSQDKINKQIDERMQCYRAFVKERKRQINNINNDYVKKLFEDDDSIYRVYLSPDTGVILFVKREVDNLGTNKYYYILTFTGKVNYNNELRDKDYNKKLKEKAKLQAKRKQVFLKMLNTACGLGKGFLTYPVLFDSDDYPYLVETCTKRNAETDYRLLQKKFYKTYGSRYDTYTLYVQTPEHTEPNSIHELIQNKEHYHVELIRFIYGENKGKYPMADPNNTYYVMFKPTEQGKARIDYMMNNK